MNETFIRVKGHLVRMLTASGDGVSRWLVLWPGLGGSSEEFVRLLREGPERGWNVAALDAPGHGRSDPWDAFTLPDMLAIWDAALEYLSPSAVVLGGHSAGAYFAAIWAAQRRPRALVLLEGAYSDPFPNGVDMEAVYRQNAAYLDARRFSSWQEFFQAERADSAHWDDDAELMLRAQMVESDGKIRPRISAATADRMMTLLAAYHVRDLPVIPCPVLLAVATPPSSQSDVRERAVANFSGRVPNLHPVWVPNAGHDLFIDNPDAVSDAVWEFLSGHLSAD